MNIAIIPARGGSKRISRKNIKLFCGKPMITHSIETAIRSELFDHVVVSTDDEEIATIAEQSGAEVPFFRSSELADDSTATAPVIADAVSRCSAMGWQADFVCCIYPCAPFIQPKDVFDALVLLKDSTAAFSFPIAQYQNAVQRALRVKKDGRVSAFYPEFELTRSQDLEPAFHDAGQFYWGAAEAWGRYSKIYEVGIGLVIPHWRVVDIDTADDWKRAELMFEAINRTDIF
jgi:pseudaminic acid cytidylyltransferase